MACQGYPNELNIRFEDPGGKASGVSPSHKSKSQSQALVTRKADSNPVLRILPPACHETAFRSQVYDRYFEVYLPHLSKQWPQLQTDLEILPSTSWLHAATSVATTDPLLTNVLTALTLAHLARREGRRDFLNQSRMLYVQAIQGLNKALSIKGQSLDDTTLAAVMALSIYEVSNFENPYFIGWTEF